MTEMNCKAPTILEILTACLKTKKPRSNMDGIIVLIFFTFMQVQANICMLTSKSHFTHIIWGSWKQNGEFHKK